MRITHISRQYLPGIGGLESAIAALAAEQRAAGHVVRVVTLNRIFARPTLNLADREIIDGIEVVRIPYWGSSRYPIAPSVLRHLGDADIVHVHAIDFFFDFMALTRFFHGKSLVATTHGGFFHTSFASTAKKIWFSTMTRLSSTAYSAIVSCSPSDHDMIQTLSPGTSRLIENGVDTRKFRGLADSRSTSIIYFGRMAPNKGLFQLLKWFSQVALRDPAWTLTIAGAPGGTSVASLEEDAHDLGIESRVRIVDSPSDEQLKTLIAGSSVYACASLHEGFGIAAVEAASAGLFPVLSRLPAFEENLRRMETGLLIDFDMPVEGAARFLAAWADWTAPRRDRMIARASAEFDWSRAANAHEALYGQIVPPRRQIGHAVIDVLSRAQAVDRIRAQFLSGSPMTVAFCNAHSVNSARSNPTFANAMQKALVLNDGIGVDLASRMLAGRAFPDNLNGTDFMPHILDAERRPLRLFLLGGAPGISAQAARAMALRFPHHSVVGHHHGYFDDNEALGVKAAILASRPDAVLVGMGHPRQEIWAATHGQDIPAVTFCIGAFLDFAAGNVSRAPAWVRRMRMEWMYRLVQEPRRLARRYLVGNLAFIAHMVRQKLFGAPSIEIAAAQPAATMIALPQKIADAA